MPFFQFGDDTGLPYKTVDERVMRASAGIMLALGIIASINGFILRNYLAVSIIAGFLMLNFLIGLLLNLRYAPTFILAKAVVGKQTPLPVGAIQKRFAWSLGLALSVLIFSLSLGLVFSGGAFFQPVCMLCVICLALLYLETAFGICVGCKLYPLAIKLGLLREPEVRPNCMGGVCELPSSQEP
ncbi:MAG: DUF4395 domain-containing protein [Myxococcota bacterium]|jgi:hypothetical protein|nr:DUF4395 domain-containing protein [Myxococcota bacterium]